MNGCSERIGVIGVDVASPYCSSLADSFALRGGEVEGRDTDGESAIFLSKERW